MKDIIKKGAIFALFLISIIIFNTSTQAQQGTININATVTAGLTCRFLTNNANINLGSLTPGSGLDVSGTTTLSFICIAVDTLSYSIIDDDGLYEITPGLHRLKHTTLSEFIEYTFDYTPKSETIIRPGRIIIARRTLNITATALYNSYQNAAIGNYSDTVTLTILP